MKETSNPSKIEIIAIVTVMIIGIPCAIYMYKDDPQMFVNSFKIIGPSVNNSLLPLGIT